MSDTVEIRVMVDAGHRPTTDDLLMAIRAYEQRNAGPTVVDPSVDVPGVEYSVRTVDVGPLVLSAGRTHGRTRRFDVDAVRCSDGSWFVELHVLGLFLGVYR